MTNLVMSCAPSVTALTTLAAVKSELGIDSAATTDDDYLNGLVASVSATVKTYLRRGELGRASYVETFRAQPRVGGYCGFGRGQLILSRWPVASITSITEDATTLTAGSDYDFDTFDGECYRLVNDRVKDWTAQLITVTYSAGYLLPGQTNRDLPADIERATVLAVASSYNARGRDAGIKSVDLAGLGKTEFGFATAQDALPPGCAALLDAFRSGWL